MTMQTLDIDRPDMPDLQFVMLVTALCTSRLTSLNVRWWTLWRMRSNSLS